MGVPVGKRTKLQIKGEQLAALRKKLKLRQEDIADLFGVSRQSYSGWENTEEWLVVQDADTFLRVFGKLKELLVEKSLVANNDYRFLSPSAKVEYLRRHIIDSQ